MRLRDPNAGTVVHVGEDQAARYLARGWVDADKPAPQPQRGRPPKTAK